MTVSAGELAQKRPSFCYYLGVSQLILYFTYMTLTVTLRD